MEELIGEDGLVRSGKGEAMLIGMALAAMTGRRYVGYVDADNYVPGAVHEYCKAYAAGLHLADSPYSMVRIFWHSKPKLRDGRLFFSRRGRSSEITNEWLNRFLAEYSGFGTEVIATGNAGEHAMSLDLGLKLRLAGGFAVEPYEFMDLFEQFGGVLECDSPDVMSCSVPVLQIETRNPHFHDNKGEEHVRGMRMQALNVVYHSPVTLPAVRRAIIDFMVSQGALEIGQEPPRERVYPPVGSLDLELLYDGLDAEALSFRQFDGRASAGYTAAPPIERDSIPLLGRLSQRLRAAASPAAPAGSARSAPAVTRSAARGSSARVAAALTARAVAAGPGARTMPSGRRARPDTAAAADRATAGPAAAAGTGTAAGIRAAAPSTPHCCGGGYCPGHCPCGWAGVVRSCNQSRSASAHTRRAAR
nr:hypothetical protein GCM10020092_016690 [Actinoplanes digitatis]